jgi:NADH:ubiquinone reductase (H+-translocating)
VLGGVSGFDPEQRCVLLHRGGSGEEGAIAYDTLVVATGAGHAHFGHYDWRPLAPGL